MKSKIFILIIVLIFCAGNIYSQTSSKDKVFFKKFIQKKRNINSIKLKYLKRFFVFVDLTEDEAEKVYNLKMKADITNPNDLKKVGLSKNKIMILKKYFVFEKRKPEKKPEKKREESTDTDLSEYIENAEIEEEEAIESLQKYLDNPLDINKASRADLMELPDISPVISVRIIRYRNDHNGFKSKSELKKIDDIDEDTYNKIRNYITVGVKKVVITTSKGKKVVKYKKTGKKDFGGRMMLRVYSRTPVDDRYLSRATNYFKKGDAGYKFLYNRFDLNFFQHLHIEFMGERDFGEAGISPGKQIGVDEVRLYDMTTWNIYLDKVGPIQRMLVGDYKLEIAQGLLFEQSTKLVILKNGIYKSPIKKKDRGIKPHHSANMSRALFGVIGQFNFGSFMIMPFISSKKWDANINDDKNDDNDNDGTDNDEDIDKDEDGIIDTMDENVEYSVSSSIDTIIQYSAGDYHRTESEIENRENFTENIYGGRVKLKLYDELFNFGGTYYKAEYSHLVDPEFTGFDKLYEFRGRDLNGASVDYDLYIRNFNFYGEIARSWHDVETWQTNKINPKFSERAHLTNLNGKEEVGYGKVMGLISDFKKVRLSTVYFDIDPDFYSPHANVLNKDDRNITGFLQGIYGKYSRNFKVWGYSRFYRKKWRSYDLGTLTYKHEYKGGFENRISKLVTFEWQGTYQYGTDQYDPDERRRLVLRYQLDWNPIKLLQFRLRYENTKVKFPYRNEPGKSEYDYGDVGFVHIRIKPTKRLTVYTRFMYFFTTSSESTVYVYENELSLWPVPVRSFSGRGYRYFIYLNNKLTKEFLFEVKYSVTHDYSLQKEFQISQHDFRFQIVMKW